MKQKPMRKRQMSKRGKAVVISSVFLTVGIVFVPFILNTSAEPTQMQKKCQKVRTLETETTNTQTVAYVTTSTFKDEHTTTFIATTTTTVATTTCETTFTTVNFQEYATATTTLATTQTSTTEKAESFAHVTNTTTTTTTVEEVTSAQENLPNSSWNGPVLTKQAGTIEGPSGKETWYNLPMQGVIETMQQKGYSYEYWVRSDGVKMYGDYIMCAANLDIRPRGTIIETSLGPAMVCDTGGFAKNNVYQIDIAVNW